MCKEEGAASSLVEPCVVIAHHAYTPTIGKLTLEAPQIAALLQPGQFLHLRLPELKGHILRRPFSVYRADKTTGRIEIVFQVVGTGSRFMHTLQSGAELDAIGPVGRGWHLPNDAQRILLVAGGIGAAPLFMLASMLSERAHVQVVMGAQSAEMHVMKDDFETTIGAENILICTDDGSCGFHGFTTELVARLIETQNFDALATCGPHPMQKAIAHLSAQAGIYCEVSLEERMACGIGACLSCVVDTYEGKKRVCVDGPVFRAHEVIWDD